MPSSPDVACEVLGCIYLSEYTVYPRRVCEVLAVHLCYDHRQEIIDRPAKQDMYTAATQLVRKSLGGK